ncbi:hypothetical protein [Georgenia subflava]|nr:hypothetical protein [Georgenia subflava]
MLRSASPRPRRRMLALAVLSLAVLLAVATLLAARLTSDLGSTPAPPPPTATSTPRVPSASPAPVRDRIELEPVAASADPHVFAGNVARAIFEWDTTAVHELGDYRGRLLVLADPAGHESPGLVADLTTYLPTTTAWAHLSQYGTQQWLAVTNVAVPDQWTQALAQAPTKSVAPGTTALTVTGARHRAGLWEGEEVAAEFDVAFTVFVICAPTYPTCHLLRLSQLDNPLR